MKTGIVLALLISLSSAQQLYAQTTRPVSPAKNAELERIISQSYISIRDLRSPILNYGGGQKQFDQLLEGFSAAFAKYLGEKFDEAADLFAKNERDIMTAATEIAKRYKKDTDELYSQLIKIALKDRMDKSVNRNTIEIEMDLTSPNDFYLKSAAHLMKMADLKLAEKNPIEAIFYYRKSKQYIFQSYTEMGMKHETRFARDLADMNGEIYADAGKVKEK